MDDEHNAQQPIPGPEADAGQEHPTKTLPLTEYEELKALAVERDEFLRRLQRAVADYQNLQKRVDRCEVAGREAARRVALLVVSLADTLARAVEAAGQTEGAEQMSEGLGLLQKEFYDILTQLGVEPIEALGRPFDPHLHEAVLPRPADGVEPNTVVGELSRGFTLDGDVIRPSRVAVAIAPTGQGDGASGGQDDGPEAGPEQTAQ